MKNSHWFVSAIVVSVALTSHFGCSNNQGVREAAYQPKSAADYIQNATRGSEADPTDSDFNTETYDEIIENEFVDSLAHPKSTFAIDVDTASYSNARRLIRAGQRPPTGAIRIEEFINYFDYHYQNPTGDHPFSVALDLATCPWEPRHQLVRVGLQGRRIENDERPDSNLVFLLDVSGSMNDPAKLPLVKSAMKLLIENLGPRDRIAIAVYAGASGLVLPSTTADKRTIILDALHQLSAGGSTNGGEGIKLAYQVAQENFIEGGINRVILCTDGDFNIGVTNQSDLIDLIQAKANNSEQGNVFLSVLGFGTGNYKDSTMEKLADKGNGNYAYIDSLLEAQKTLVEQMSGTLMTIAKDVKIQVDFNPGRVSAYRLIGYENRLLANEDFADDSKDAGEIGAGHSVTALYEIVPSGTSSPARTDADSQFVATQLKPGAADSPTMLTVSLRYKLPEASASQEFEVQLNHEKHSEPTTASTDFQFATAVAASAMLLRDSKFKGTADWDWVIDVAQENLGEDRHGFRNEFVQLSKQARMIGTRPVSKDHLFED